MTEKRCDTCRYWSEMIARSCPGGMEAICLSAKGPMASKYVSGKSVCGEWKDNRYGAIDAPPSTGAVSRAAYAADGEPV